MRQWRKTIQSYRIQHYCALGQGKAARNISSEYRTVPSFTQTCNSRLGTPSNWSLACLLSRANNVLWYINIMVGILLKKIHSLFTTTVDTSTLHVHHCKCESLWVYITSKLCTAVGIHPYVYMTRCTSLEVHITGRAYRWIIYLCISQGVHHWRCISLEVYSSVDVYH